MSREQTAGMVTVVVLAVVIVVLVAVNRSGKPAEEPSRVVFDLFQRAKEGDVEGYVGCLDKGLREEVEGTLDEMGKRAFREQIRSIGEQVKGVSVSEERRGTRDAQLRVELVYADRTHNDVQTFGVREVRGGWLIADMGAADKLKMPIPYGTPAYPLEMDTQGDGTGDGS